VILGNHFHNNSQVNLDFITFANSKSSTVDKLFERKYSLEVPKLQYGLNEDVFTVDSTFFAAFELSPIQEGNVKVVVTIDKCTTHLDAKFHFTGEIMIECDRCLEHYPFRLDFESRIVYTFEESLEFDTDEVVLIEESTPILAFAQDFYEFISLQIPVRRVPAPEVHICAPKVLELLGLNPDGSPREPAVEDDNEPEAMEEDPRWQALKKLKSNQD
jgi:uncharacterized metal-binding protein YceD (DUF177 family)